MILLDSSPRADQLELCGWFAKSENQTIDKGTVIWYLLKVQDSLDEPDDQLSENPASSKKIKICTVSILLQGTRA